MSNKFKPLKIRKLKEIDEEEVKLKREINPILPQINKNQLILLIGGISCGKTTMLTNFCYNNDYYNDLFDMKYIISPSIFNDKSAKAFRDDDKAIIIDKYSDEAIETIIEEQTLKDYEDKQNQPFSLLLLDDCVDPKGCGSNNSAISNLCCRMRHLNLNIFLSAQSINQGFSSIIRANARHIILKKLRNKKEYNKILEQFSDMFGGEDNFNRMYKYTFDGKDDKYNFLFMNLDDMKCYKNFEELLYED